MSSIKVLHGTEPSVLRTCVPVPHNMAANGIGNVKLRVSVSISRDDEMLSSLMWPVVAQNYVTDFG